MKKLLVVSSVATAAFLATGAASHNAHAAEVSQSEQQLAETALNNPSELNQHPVQAGAYNIDFVYNCNEFHFESDGSNWSWSYNATSASNSSVQPTQATTTQAAPAQQAAPVAQQQSAPAQQQTKSYNTQAQSYSAPAQASSGSSVNIPAHLQLIAQRESGGNIHAINPSSGAAGKYQFLQTTWDSVVDPQWRGVSPASAPESVQDAAAVKLYNGGAGAGHWVTA